MILIGMAATVLGFNTQIRWFHDRCDIFEKWEILSYSKIQRQRIITIDGVVVIHDKNKARSSFLISKV